jgi:REP element-mobilizing transposase RayT
MARPWRIQFPGAIYHVTARGNNRQDIFAGDDDRRLFLELLARAADRFRLDLFAFGLMTNHYHLFLRTWESNLAAAMKWLNAASTGHFNRRRHRSGHLFQGQYQSRWNFLKNAAAGVALSSWTSASSPRAMGWHPN